MEETVREGRDAAGARPHEEAERRRRAVEQMARMARTVAVGQDVDAVVAQIIESMLAVFPGCLAVDLVEPREDGPPVVVASRGSSSGVFPAGQARPAGGVIDRAAREQRALWIDDLRDAATPPEARVAADRRLMIAAGIRATLALPLVAGGRTVGVLGMAFGEPHRFAEEDVALAQGVADHAATALELSRLLVRERAARQQGEALAEIERELIAELHPERLFHLLVARAKRLFEGECGIYLVTGTGQLVARVDTDPGVMTQRVAVGEGVAGRCAETRRGLRVNDYPRWMHALPWAVAHGLRHVMAQPLVNRDQLLGVVSVSRRGPTAAPFREEDLSVLARFAALAALAIRNAERYEERSRAEATLRESEQRYRLLAENVVDVVALFDMSLRQIYVSPSVLRLRGVTPEEALRQTPAERFTPASAEVVARVLAEELAVEATGQGDPRRSRTVELELPRKDGSTVWVETTTSFVRDEQGRPVGIVSVSRDIDGRRRAEAALREREAELRQAQKMEAVGRLAGGIAHDFNNVLTVIGGRTELLLAALEPGSPQHRAAELIRQAAQRAAGLTRQLLAFSRKQVLQPKVLDLGEAARSMGQMLRRMIGEDVELHLPEPSGATLVHADPSQIEQILINLAVNARDAMPQGGRLSIVTDRIVVDEGEAHRHPGARPGPHVRLCVRDTGTGMDDETRAHLFEPFFTTKALGKGTGLGLSTVYGIVQQSGGFVDVESAPGKGATFRVCLPEVPAADAGGPATAGPTARGIGRVAG